MKNYIRTSEKIAIENYPYGFREKTTLYDYLEFNPKKGYRHIRQTVNPKTGKLNKPKNSTYYPLLVRHLDDEKNVQCTAYRLNGDCEINTACKFLAENFALFTVDEIAYLYKQVFFFAAVDLKATVIYGGSNLEDLKPLYDPFMTLCREGVNNPQMNLFGSMVLDSDAIEATKPKDFNPFTVTSFRVV